MSLFPNKFLLNVFTCGLILSCNLNAVTAATATQTPSQTNPSAQKTKLEWKTYEFKESGFSIDFPKKPERVQQSIDVPKSNVKINYETYLSEPSDNMVFVVSVWNYPSEIDMTKPEVNLQDGFSGMLSALPGAEVLHMKMNELNGFKGLEFLVKNDEIYFQGKLILVYNTLYQVFTVYKGTEDMTENYNHFIDSFTLINPEQHQPTTKPSTKPSQKSEGTKMNV